MLTDNFHYSISYVYVMKKHIVKHDKMQRATHQDQMTWLISRVHTWILFVCLIHFSAFSAAKAM